MKILLGMSGGLDSTYAAIKMLQEGHTVEGAVLVMHDFTDIESAREAADGVGIPLHVIDCRAAFEKNVVKNFISQYLLARTPNPCVICNSEVKFRVLLDYALENGFDKIATGHYAKTVTLDKNGKTRYTVSRSPDTAKDQTYMLWRLPQDIFSHLYLPLFEEKKADVRAQAKERGVSAADKDESQEICFVPSGDYAAFIEERTHPSPHGNFVDEEGNILGEHKGIIRYTVGQRKGLGVSAGQRVFVTKIDVDTNLITLSANDSYNDTLTVSDIVFSGISEPEKNDKISLLVKLRYHATPTPCVFEYLGQNRAKVVLATHQRAVTPGQSAVFYDGDVLAAGGFID